MLLDANKVQWGRYMLNTGVGAHSGMGMGLGIVEGDKINTFCHVVCTEWSCLWVEMPVDLPFTT